MCGVAGFIGSRNDAVSQVISTLVEEQNRGMASSGVVVLTESGAMRRRTRSGSVEELLKRLDLHELPGHAAIGHLRYFTSGDMEDAQPFRGWMEHQQIALAVNGDTVNIRGMPWQQFVSGLQVFRQAQSDTEALLQLVAQTDGNDLVDRLCRAFQEVEGAWSLVALTGDGKLVAMRDPWAFRPLLLCRTPHGYLVASETKSLPLNLESIESVLPGEIVCIDPDLTLKRWTYRAPAQRLYVCSFEWTYFKDPGSPGVYNFRTECGQRLAQEAKESGHAPQNIDGVVPMLDSGRDAANSFAHAMQLPVICGMNRSRLSKDVRAFLGSTTSERQHIVALKHIPNPEAVAGKRVYVLDDSIVRSDTITAAVRLLRSVGVRQVHVVSASPPIKWPCYYGIATPTRDELVASHRTTEAVCQVIGADSLRYLSLDGHRAAYRHLSIPGFLERLEPNLHVCDACMSGDYPPFVPPHHSLSTGEH